METHPGHLDLLIVVGSFGESGFEHASQRHSARVEAAVDEDGGTIARLGG